MDITDILRKQITKHKELNKHEDPENRAKRLLQHEEEMFQTFYHKFKKKSLIESDNSYKIIPRFFTKETPGSNKKLVLKFREEARSLFLHSKSTNILNNNELKTLYNLLEKHHTPPSIGDEQFISYEGYLKVAMSVEEKCRQYLTATAFAKLQEGDVFGRINIMTLFNYIMRRVWLRQARIGLSLYDNSGQGYLYEAELETYIQELIPTLPQLEGLESSFHSFYVCTAVRKFMFFLDPMRTGRLSIDDILASSFLEELLELRDGDLPKDAQDLNWFSAPSTLQVYGHYLNLDRDHNGMLSREELSGYGSGTLTSVFLARVFQECLTYDGEMDYKTYLDFVLALENRHEPQSLHYLFKILDIDNKGYLTGFTLNYFFKAIQEQMSSHGAEPVSFENVKDEIFDMVKPEDPSKITLQDLINCQQGDTMVSILIEFHGFWAYENREAMVTDTGKEDAHHV